MPAELNFFDTYTLMAVYKRVVPKKTFFRDRYFPTSDEDIFASNKVLTEYMDGDQKMAAFVAPRVGAIPMERIRTTSNSVSRLISLQSMRPNISRFCKKSSATKIFGRIWTASFTTRKRSRKRAMLQRFPAPQRCPTRFLCRVLSSRGQSAHTPAPLVRSAQLG